MASIQKDLVDAARVGDLVALRAALDAGADPDVPARKGGYTALITAANKGQALAFEILLPLTKDLHAKVDEYDRDVLWHILFRPHRPIHEIVVRHLVALHGEDEGRGRYLMAMKHQFVFEARIQTVIAENFPSDAWRTPNGGTAKGIVQQMSNGKEILERINAGKTRRPATKKKHDLQALMQAGAQSGDIGTLREAIGQGYDVNKPFVAGGSTPLMEAAANGHALAVEYLLSVGADPALTNSASWGPLEKAIDADSAACVRAILAAGVSPNRHESYTALMLAAEKGASDDVLTALLEGGAELNPLRTVTVTRPPLLFALQRENFATALTLLRLGADPLAHNASNGNALHALFWGASYRYSYSGKTWQPRQTKPRQQLIIALLAAGVDPEAQDDDGRSPLDYAVRHLDQQLPALVESHRSQPRKEQP